MSIVKKKVAELPGKTNYRKSNLTAEKSFKLIYLSENRNLTMKRTDKGGKIIIMDTADYIE